MSIKIRNKLYLSNVEDMDFEGKTVDDGLLVTPGTGVTKDDNIKLVNHVRLSMSSLSVTITDTGGANGGYGSVKLCDLPDTHLLVFAAAANLSFTEAAAGIGNTAALKYSVGTAAEATNDTLDSTQANLIASTDATLVSSAKANVMNSSSAVAFIDASSGTAAIHLNFGIPNADISASGAIVVTGYVDLFYIDLGNDA